MSFTKLKKYIYDTFGGTKKELIDTINGNVFPNDKNMGRVFDTFLYKFSTFVRFYILRI